jgi:hypothetical protein
MEASGAACERGLPHPGAVPLTTRNGSLVADAVNRAVGHPNWPIASIPLSRMRSRRVVIGTTGTGKTTLVLLFSTVLTGPIFPFNLDPRRLLAVSASR